MATGGLTAQSVLGSIIQGHLECSICHTRYQEPKMLDCSHSFCLRCLKELKQSQKPDDKIKCPLCQRETVLPEGGVAKLTTNYGLVSLVEEVAKQEQLLKGEVSKVICQTCDEEHKAISRCMDCESYLCQQCQTAHQRFVIFKSHKILPVDEIAGNSFPNTMGKEDISKCEIHLNKELCFYCSTCEMLICRQCASSIHKEPIHMYSDLKTAIDICLQEACERISHAHHAFLSGTNWQSLRDRLDIMFRETNSLISLHTEQKIKEIKLKDKEIKLKDKQLKRTANLMYKKKDRKLAEMMVAENTVKMGRGDITDANCREILRFRQGLLHDSLAWGETEKLTRQLSFISFKENKEGVELGSLLEREKWELLSTSETGGDFIAAFSTGDMVISNKQTNEIVRLGPDSKVINVSKANKHIAIAVNKNDQLVVLSNELKIVILNKEYQALNQFHPGNEANIEGKPTCLAVDDDNLIAVGYKDTQQVSLHKQDGTLVKKLRAPMIDKYLTISNKQLIYTNSGRKNVMVVDYECNIKYSSDTCNIFAPANGVCCDKAEDIYVCFPASIGHLSPEIELIEHFSLTNGKSPSGIAYTPDGKLAVACDDCTQIYHRV